MNKLPRGFSDLDPARAARASASAHCPTATTATAVKSFCPRKFRPPPHCLLYSLTTTHSMSPASTGGPPKGRAGDHQRRSDPNAGSMRRDDPPALPNDRGHGHRSSRDEHGRDRGPPPPSIPAPPRATNVEPPWVDDETFGLIHQGTVCVACTTRVRHIMEHRHGPGYAAALEARRERLEVAADRAARAYREQIELLAGNISRLQSELLAATEDAAYWRGQVDATRRREITPRRVSQTRGRSRSRSPVRARSQSVSRSRSRSRVLSRTQRRRSSTPRRRSRSPEQRRSASPVPRRQRTPPRARSTTRRSQAGSDQVRRRSRSGTDSPRRAPAKTTTSGGRDPYDSDATDSSDALFEAAAEQRRERYNRDPSAYWLGDRPPGRTLAERLSNLEEVRNRALQEPDTTSTNAFNRSGTANAHGVTLDMSLPFPSLRPTAQSVNPLTGVHWTSDELIQWPRGYPGLPSDVPFGTFQVVQQRTIAETHGLPPPLHGRIGGRVFSGGGGPSVMPDANIGRTEGSAQRQRIITRGMISTDAPDTSRTDLEFLWDTDTQTYRWPCTDEEVRRLREVRNSPGNLDAFNMVTGWLNLVNSTAPSKRSRLHQLLVSVQWKRPEWVPVKEQTLKRKRMQAERAKEVQQDGENGAPTPVSPLPRPPIMLEEDVQRNIHLEDTDDPMGMDLANPTTTPAVSKTVAAAQGWRRIVHLANITPVQLEELQVALEAHPNLVIPGIVRGPTGRALNENALRGLHRITQTGPSEASLESAMAYASTVAALVIVEPHIELPGQSSANIAYTGSVTNRVAVLSHIRSVVAAGRNRLMGYDVAYSPLLVPQCVTEWVNCVLASSNQSS